MLKDLSRKRFLELSSLAGCSAFLPFPAWASKSETNFKKIPSSGEKIPVIGMGTWISFNVGSNEKLRRDRTEVLQAFFEAGGGMVDSSPMYGSAEEVLGYALKRLDYPKSLFSATKVWTSSKEEGLKQFKNSKRLWGVETLDLEQIHNLVGWEAHLEALMKLKKKKEIRYVGITTSHGRRHREFEGVMRKHPLDFVQLTYNIDDREVERRLLPLAQEKGIAVIANRPYQGGNLIRRLEGKPLPEFAKELEVTTWPVFLLKYIVSHPAITVAIPATSQVRHMKENMSAGRGRLPDAKMRKKMEEAFASI